MRWDFPYPSRRMPVIAERVVATGQPLAATAGLAVLEEGGTAVDAAICAAITLTVVEPTSNGIGGDAFAIVWDGTLHGLNASGRAPAGQPRSAFAGAERMPRTGWGSVTVPGAVSAWIELHARFGALPFGRLFEPAVRHAERGYPVSPMTAAAWARSVERFRKFPEWMNAFAPHGRAPAPGERVRLPDHARTLRAIADSGGDAFYRGELAQRIEDAARADGAAMRADDLRAHRAEWASPWSIAYRDAILHELPPNGQGVAALIALGLLRHHRIDHLDPDGAECIHLQVECMRAAFADAHRYVGDPANGRVDASGLLEPQALAARAERIDPARARRWDARPIPGAGTVYVAAADHAGRAASFIQSNYEGFGSGVVIPGTGIAMQNRGAGFSLEPGHANEYAPGARPFHTIIPGFLTRGGRALAAFGVMGGPMQAQGHVQFTVRTVDFGMNPQAAIDAPRWQVMDDGTLALEPGFPESTVAGLAQRGHAVRVDAAGTHFFGGAQCAWRTEADDAWIAASDPRRDGQAAGT